MILRALTFTLLSGIILAPEASQAAGSHPHSASARRDLRRAQVLLRVPDDPKIAQYLKAADGKIESAINELDRAAILDSKDMDDHPAIDIPMKLLDRIIKLGELLRSAKADIEGEEDNPSTHAWRTTVLGLIYEANHAVFQASYEAGFEPKVVL